MVPKIGRGQAFVETLIQREGLGMGGIYLLSFVVLSCLLWPIAYILKTAWNVESVNFPLLLFQISGVILQSAMSATLSVGLGFFVCLSYLQKGSWMQKTLYIGLLPQVLPTLMIIFSYFKFYHILKFTLNLKCMSLFCM